MRWRNSQNIRTAIEQMLAALKRHDADMGYVLDCKQRVKDAEAELEKAELRFGETQADLMVAQNTLREEGFITNDSAYQS